MESSSSSSSQAAIVGGAVGALFLLLLLLLLLLLVRRRRKPAPVVITDRSAIFYKLEEEVELFPGVDEMRSLGKFAAPAVVAETLTMQRQRGVYVPTAWGESFGQEMNTDDTVFVQPPDVNESVAFVGAFEDVTLLRDETTFGGESDVMERSGNAIRLPRAPQSTTDEAGEYMHLAIDSGSRRGFMDDDLMAFHRALYPTLQAEEEVARITDRLNRQGAARRESDAELIFANNRASRISIGDFQFARESEDVEEDLTVIQAADRGEAVLLSRLLAKGE